MSPKALLQTSPGMVNCPQFLATTFRWEPQECLGDGGRQVLKTALLQTQRSREVVRQNPVGAQASARARWSCSHAMASVTTHGPTPKARSTIRASPTIPPWMESIAAWPLRSARITSKPLIVA